MDFLLIFFYILLVGLLVSPFLYVAFVVEHKELETETERSELFDRRAILLDNLKDLKIEFDTGKLTEQEFKSISAGLIQELEEQDKKIELGPIAKPQPIQTASTAKFCHNCGFKIEISGAKFCPECGTKLIA
ncbi:zinc-ribbon domain-containing protein [Leptospira langatensis]|uniref:Zinc-ribbon domain-containing protein n=1 Tax=Leptospira langatensis TaxID=2484983 RepID=A0A5F1ZTG6_9LEPT|nr:zinc ribbon domain-containing protein [Leptospira langatensis]TGK00212.1 zinc-ribbon domain-containing protein [Leptospira langatensis]TGL41157.1 zinc-ribbon domain-containing protein [Leptospira langatensis]